MTVAAVLLAFVSGWTLRALLELTRHNRRRGGYVPMASVHPREPKS